MIPKVITPFTFEDRQNIILIEAHSHGVDNKWMRKSAAAHFERELSELKPEKGMAYLHMLALGDGEYYGSNRNGDYFPKKANQDYHDTFVKFGHVFKHHKNKDPKKASGHVLSSSYNDDMRRVELLTKVSEDKWSEELTDLENGKDVPVSMSCTVPFDTCSICGNEAPSRKQYCDHLKYAMTSILDDGRQVYAINDEPTFFDISRVVKPADRTAFVLKKAASAVKVASGADLAEELGLYVPASVLMDSSPVYIQEKAAIAGKLAEIEKELDGVAVAGKVRGKGLFNHANSFSDEIQLVEDEDIEEMSKDANLWYKLAEAKVSLPVKDFVKLISGPKWFETKKLLPEIKSAVPGMFRKLANSEYLMDVCSDSAYDAKGGAQLQSITGFVKEAFSLDPSSCDRRTTVSMLRNVDTPIIKSASDRDISSDARAIVNEYAKYKISLASALSDRDMARLMILQNYV